MREMTPLKKGAEVDEVDAVAAVEAVAAVDAMDTVDIVDAVAPVVKLISDHPRSPFRVPIDPYTSPGAPRCSPRKRSLVDVKAQSDSGHGDLWTQLTLALIFFLAHKSFF
jgi:hypothetical protein